MCKSLAEGGQRCSAHTRPGYEAAMKATAGTFTFTNDQAEKIIRFASTKTGAIELEEVIKQSLVATPFPESRRAAELSEYLRRGRLRREATKVRVEQLKAEKARLAASEPAKPKISLSPSRANDFQACPLAYRYKTIDRFPEPKTSAPVRGTLVHSILEKIFDETPENRTIEKAISMLPGEWDAMAAADPELMELLDETGDTEWLAGAEQLLKNYFHMENPAKVPFGDREQPVEYRLSDDVLIRGFIDRLDRHPVTGDLRIVDYKTGKSPKLGFEDKAMFQLRFYALAIWRTTGNMPKLLKLMYLGDGQPLEYVPTKEGLLETEEKVNKIWKKIQVCLETGEFRPRKSKLCGYCNFKDKCPEFGGTIPPMPIGVTPGFHNGAPRRG